jgi:hypothetical protein
MLIVVYAACHAFILMLNVIVLNVVSLSVVAPTNVLKLLTV